LTDPAQVRRALAHAQGGAWLPQELQARQTTVRHALEQLDRQQQRLLDAHLAEVVGLAELERTRQELDRRRATLLAQQRQLDAIAQQRLELRAVADGIEKFCQTIRSGLATATSAQQRLLVELLVDRVVVTVPTRPVVVGAAATLRGASQARLPPASPACCDRPAVESLHLHSVKRNLVAHHRI
jgi:site-specific DNA recombinase